jgi:pyruvate dehydrogenase E2 component (dihydrolipoamide acetyltransferase)
MAELVMPILGADMEAGTLVAWRKRPGDRVARGDIVAEVETDKGLIEIEIFTDGVIERILIEPGTKVPVGTVLALVRADGEAAAPPAEPTLAGAPPPRARPPSSEAGGGPVAPGTPGAPGVAPAAREADRAPGPPAPIAPGAAGVTPALGAAPAPRASPAARRLAAERGVDLTQVSGTGPGGAIERADVERAAAAAPAPPGPETDRQARMRQTIAAAMARSKREIPHYYLATTVDMSAATAWLARVNPERPIAERLLPAVLLIKATALALREVPELNGTWAGERAVASPDVHVGVAIALRRGGLVVPALHHTDRQSLDALMRAFRDLVTRARAGTLRSSELSLPTITVTSLGDQGVETVFGIIYPPQVAIVGFGKVVERPWAAGGEVVVRPVVTATLAADHRVSDGHRGGLFLAALDRLLQRPEAL